MAACQDAEQNVTNHCADVRETVECGSPSPLVQVDRLVRDTLEVSAC